MGKHLNWSEKYLGRLKTAKNDSHDNLFGTVVEAQDNRLFKAIVCCFYSVRLTLLYPIMTVDTADMQITITRDLGMYNVKCQIVNPQGYL